MYFSLSPTLITVTWPWRDLAKAGPQGDPQGRREDAECLQTRVMRSHIRTGQCHPPWMMELFLAGTLSGVGCSSPVGLASTGMGPAENRKLH